MHFFLAVADILNNCLFWMVQVIISHKMPGGTTTHGKWGAAEVKPANRDN